MDAMATTHHNDGLRRREHVVPADRTVTLGGPFDAAVGILNGNSQTDTASLDLVRTT